VKRMGENGITIITSKNPAEFTAFVKAETDRFGKAIKDGNIPTE
jgi:hypothetical protein